MPSLSTFRLDELSASAASRGDSSRGDCDISLPSLSSFRMEEMSLASSYHSGTNHLSDQSAEGWSSFTSGNVSADTDSDEEFATSSSAPGSDRGDSTLKSTPAPKSGILKDGSDPAPDDANCNLTSNARPPRRRNPETEELNNILPMRPPRRTLSPVTGKRTDISEQGAPPTGKDEEIPRPTRSSSPERTPVERTESLPLSVLQKPRPAQEGSSSSVRVSGDSSSSLRGGDSLPRLPRRTSTLDDRSSHAEEEADDDTKVSVEGSRASDEDTKISFDDVTDVSDGDVSIDSDLSDDESIGRRKPLHAHDKHDRDGAPNSRQGRIIESTERIARDSDLAASLKEQSISIRATNRISQPNQPQGEKIKHTSHQSKSSEAQDQVDSQKQSIGEPEASTSTREATTPQEASLEESPEVPSPNVESQNEKSDHEAGGTVEHQKEASEKGGLKPEAPTNEADPSSSSNAGGKDGKGPVRNRKSPTSVRELEGALPAKEPDEKTPDESGTTSAEESGTTASDTEAEESEEINNHSGKKEDSKRGRLLRKMSNSFKNIGR
eukprot:CAMPEP_0117050780 /NCGR_PEP_ID=MMETSP0472-20121206/35060_1 /TAXON_ID=693140 ORGANISM="Tiarina fusus, Strain LIS" /NCGR_SAMPLE_ID=MMETSP0472 /ASSEMBLY_ACC=CAM_ASM_000603 /LENGTH=551 /DNA_ID=CAMNT_0004764691 /DNA_START=78 /DNA_END=1730 /DNA_ORIENTATION=-